MPSKQWHTHRYLHPGSSQQEIENEPDWGSIKSGHYIGYRNDRGRPAGITHTGDEHVQYPNDVKEAWNLAHSVDEKAARGELINFRHAIDKQEGLHLEHPKNRPFGWRYMFDVTEDWIKNQQDWPANLAKRKEEEKKQAAEASKDQGKGSEDSANGETNDANQSKDESGQDGHNERGHEQDGELTDEERRLCTDLKNDKHYIEELRPSGGEDVQGLPDYGATLVDEADQFTPDNWVAHSSQLVRLTGKHPLNAEPPLSRLYAAGFITPNDLHYVRNHGSVPRLLWEFHKVAIDGGQDRKLTLSMDDLRNDFVSISIAVLLACDNVRRKELNMIKRTTGFNWGPGGVSNAVWKGPLLRDVLLAAGVPERFPDEDEKRYYLHFRGADALENGNYETSIDFRYAMDADNDMILAYEMNGVPLPPDHGYPVRVVIPGYVGGRCVKWLEKIWVSDRENDSYYHMWDNRVVPGFIQEKSSETSRTLFSHPDTACYEQMLNSVITKPAQGEKLDLQGGQQKYRIEGFAYNGRGDEVQRVEVSLDDGKTWLYCLRRYPERPVRHGKKFWTWLFWHVEVDTMDLLKTDGIIVRAWNPFKMTQPEKPLWNILGTMNSCWYVVKPELTRSEGSTPCIVFRHPTEPATGDGGWMKLSAENQIKAAAQTSSTPQKQFTRDEIEKHNTEQDCWIVLYGKVYDATSVLSWHPGGSGAIMPHAGRVHQDTTTEYESIHDDYAHEKLEECVLGTVTEKAAKLLQKTAEIKDDDSEVPPDQALKRHHWVQAKLIKRRAISHDTRLYTFQLPDQKLKVGLGTCQHIEFGFHLKNRLLNRPYTPTRPLLPFRKNADEDDIHDGSGTFDLTIKTYFPDEDQPGGAFSNIIDTLPIGGNIEMRGPFGDVIYHGQGRFTIHGEERRFSKISLVLGGTGITPGYQLIARVVLTQSQSQDNDDGGDQTQIRAINANKSQDDILLRDELEELERKSKGRFKLTHILSHPDDGDHDDDDDNGRDKPKWTGFKGHVDEKIIRDHLFAPNDETLVLLCGPPGLINKAALPALEEWGYKQNYNLYGL